MTIDCIYCDGTGWLTERRAAAIQAEKEIWCRCGNPSQGNSYHPDTPAMKHHYTCDDCGKVTQIG